MAYTQAVGEKEAQPKPEEIVIKSSFLSHAMYDTQSLSLTLTFKNGYSSVHKFVYKSVWDEFRLSKSQGSFYANTLKKQYPAVPIATKMKVSDLEKAKKELNPRANRHYTKNR